MKSKDRIPLNSTVGGIDTKGNLVTINETRTVAEEIKRLRDMGAHNAADRLEGACDDDVTDTALLVDPTNSGGKKSA